MVEPRPLSIAESATFWWKMDAASLSESATSNAFSCVCENFKQEQEFGWFIPAFCETSDIPQKLEDPLIGGDLKYKQAAVMFLLACINGSLHILMTKRSNTVRTHRGTTHKRFIMASIYY